MHPSSETIKKTICFYKMVIIFFYNFFSSALISQGEVKHLLTEAN